MHNHHTGARSAQLLSLLQQRILILDGATGTMIQGYKPGEAEYRGERFKTWPSDLKGNNDLLVLTQPQIMREIHRAYFEAGADIVQTNTFGANAISQADYGMEALAFEMNVERAEGAIAFVSGEPLIALYIYKKGGASRTERVYKAAQAVKFVWEDSLLPESTISLHSRINALGLEKQFPDAKVGKMELVPPAILTNPRNVGDLKVLSGRSDDVAHKILDWAREGYIVINLIRLYSSDPQAAARAASVENTLDQILEVRIAVSFGGFCRLGRRGRGLRNGCALILTG